MSRGRRFRRFGEGGGSGGGRRRTGPLILPTLVGLVVVAVLFLIARRWPERVPSVVVYTSQDQVYAEPILREFERKTGVRVLAVYDSEAVKTVGLANRLIAERSHPRCDIFWNNEELRTRQLAARGVVTDEAGWHTVGHRSRRIVVNTNLLATGEAPTSLLALTNAIWKGRIAMAYPLFGTTATHFLALRQHWGNAAWRNWCRALQANRPMVVDGNSVVVRLVGQGEVAIGLTDSDDIAAGQREGYPIEALELTTESLLIPNTIAPVLDAPTPGLGQRLAGYLASPETVLQLVDAHALESMNPAAGGIGLQPDWTALLQDLETETGFLREVFLR